MNGTTLVQVRHKAQITLPQKMRQVLGIREGDYLEARVENKKVVLSPKIILDELPTVELSPRGEKMLKEALNDLEKGVNLRVYNNVDDLIESLHQQVAEVKKRNRKK